ncbi:hypothetical protein UT300005_10030 [Clostridium sp. CTA-5]
MLKVYYLINIRDKKKDARGGFKEGIVIKTVKQGKWFKEKECIAQNILDKTRKIAYKL